MNFKLKHLLLSLSIISCTQNVLYAAWTDWLSPVQWLNSITSLITEHPKKCALGLSVLVGLGAWYCYAHTPEKIYQLSPVKNEKVMLGKLCVNVPARSCKEFIVVQVPVVRQQGLTCGYHALKNTLQLGSALKTGNRAELFQLTDVMPVQKAFGNQQSIWRQVAQLKALKASYSKHCTSDGEDISSYLIEELISFEQKHNVLGIAWNQLPIVVVDDIGMIGKSGFDWITHAVKELMQRSRSKDISHIEPIVTGYIISTGKNIGNSTYVTVTRANHWYAIIAYRDESRQQIIYCVLDSNSSSSSALTNGHVIRTISKIHQAS